MTRDLLIRSPIVGLVIIPTFEEVTVSSSPKRAPAELPGTPLKTNILKPKIGGEGVDVNISFSFLGGIFRSFSFVYVYVSLCSFESH